jgi:hypothetical protein
MLRIDDEARAIVTFNGLTERQKEAQKCIKKGLHYRQIDHMRLRGTDK